MAFTTHISSSSTTTYVRKHDVFINFRGEDTRHGFTSHLQDALCRRKIDAFVDAGLSRGLRISEALPKAIEGSKISIVILSKHYSSSTWCLDELVKNLECRKINGQIVIPVFYHVQPSDVGKQTGSFYEAFVMHEQQLRGDFYRLRMAKWKVALTEVATLAGWICSVDRLETQLVDLLVEDVSKKLNRLAPSNHGLDSQIQQVKPLVHAEMLHFRIKGNWGRVGIGKTTNEDATFNQISGQFEASYYMANIRHDEIGLFQGHNAVRKEIGLFQVQNAVRNDPPRSKIGMPDLKRLLEASKNTPVQNTNLLPPVPKIRLSDMKRPSEAFKNAPVKNTNLLPPLPKIRLSDMKRPSEAFKNAPVKNTNLLPPLSKLHLSDLKRLLEASKNAPVKNTNLMPPLPKIRMSDLQRLLEASKNTPVKNANSLIRPSKLPYFQQQCCHN